MSKRLTIFQNFQIACVCLVVGCFVSPNTWAQNQRNIQSEPELRNPTVVITGSRLDKAKAYVGKVAPPGWRASARGVPRWNTELCVSVIGPSMEQGQTVADRIALKAMAVGLEAGAPGCDTNLLIIVTNDPETLLPNIAREHRAVFGFSGDANIDTGGSGISLSDFIADDRPVRWRQVVETIGADGMPLDGDARTGPGGAPVNIPVVRGEASRLRSSVRRQLSRVILVVDTRHTAGLTLDQVADYLAFVALADVDPDADLSGFPSILNLFNPAAAHPAAMTDWDTAFLGALYKSRSDAASGRMQYSDIARRVAASVPAAE